MEILVLVVLSLLILWLIVSLFTSMPIPGPGPKKMENEKKKNCPLCGSELEKYETVRSVVYPGKPDKITHMHGCPRCSGPNAHVPRYCPVCKKSIPTEGYVIGRMFENGNKRHLHVLGCTLCRTPKKR